MSYLVRMDGGEGYCPFFSSPQILKRVDEPWFSGNLRDRDSAILFLIVEGSKSGHYVALTSRTIVIDVENSLLERGSLSCVAHHIKNPGPGFKNEDADSCGMTYVRLIRGNGARQC